MRVGHNPMEATNVKPMPDLMAAVIVHLPDQKGYHENRLEVIQICLQSLRKNAGRRLKVLVWDNGSCDEARAWLREVYKPDFLIHSPNVGKSNARASILRMFPVETILCLSDDDMLYYPGWLDPQLKLLTGMPNVGVVSGWPVRTNMKQNVSTTLRWAHNWGTVARGKFIPECDLRDFAVSIGYEEPRILLKSLENEDDIIVEYEGLKAYANAQHCQFLCYAGRIAPIAVWDQEAMASERPFDAAINNAGLLRLTTLRRYTRHLGNVIDAETRREIEGWPLQ